MPTVRILCLQAALLLSATASQAQQVNDFGLPVPYDAERKWPNISAMPPADTDGVDGGVLNKFKYTMGTIGNELNPTLYEAPKFFPARTCVQDIASTAPGADTLEFCNATDAAVILSFEIGTAKLSVGLPPGQSSDLATPESTAIVAAVGSPQNRYAVQKGHFYTIEKENDQLVVNSP